MLPTTHLIAVVVTALYGIVCLVGGILGYVRADSMASLVAGGISGVLLLLCAAGIFFLPAVSLGGAIIIAVALLGRFVPILIRQWDRFGESNSPIVALVVSIGGVLTIVVCALALAAKAGPPSIP
jgi:uncharacterized membrane protein (UPF0136 family)